MYNEEKTSGKTSRWLEADRTGDDFNSTTSNLVPMVKKILDYEEE